eukprot:1139251-Pelagomonas_calceolata.AAC.6
MSKQTSLPLDHVFYTGRPEFWVKGGDGLLKPLGPDVSNALVSLAASYEGLQGLHAKAISQIARLLG